MRRICILIAAVIVGNAKIIAQISDPSTPSGATMAYEQGLVLKDDKKINEAAKKFEEALRIDPKYAAAAYELGWCRNDQKDYPAAVKYLRIAYPAMSDHYKVNFELGYALEKLNKSDSAVIYYNRCISI